MLQYVAIDDWRRGQTGYEVFVVWKRYEPADGTWGGLDEILDHAPEVIEEMLTVIWERESTAFESYMRNAMHEREENDTKAFVNGLSPFAKEILSLVGLKKMKEEEAGGKGVLNILPSFPHLAKIHQLLSLTLPCAHTGFVDCTVSSCVLDQYAHRYQSGNVEVGPIVLKATWNQQPAIQPKRVGEMVVQKLPIAMPLNTPRPICTTTMPVPRNTKR
jgi:hypothetical protein